MKNQTKLLSIIALCTLLNSCSISENDNSKKKTNLIPKTELDKVSWMVGSWGNIENGVSTSENWRKKDENTLEGESFSIAKDDTVFFESNKIQVIDSKLYFIPLVKDQNNGEPVKFKLQSSTDKQLVFVNSKHDFPQKITYNKITKDSLYAEISGNMEGKETKMGFPLKRNK